MTALEILTMLQRDIHTTVFATVDEEGLPQTCVIDLMLVDEGGLYFLTAKGKAFYDRLMAKPFVAISGLKGEDTLSSVSISVRGHIRCIGQERLAEIFEQNPYMAKIYPTPVSRKTLEVFQLDRGVGELFDLSQRGRVVHPVLSSNPPQSAGRHTECPFHKQDDKDCPLYM